MKREVFDLRTVRVPTGYPLIPGFLAKLMKRECELIMVY